MPLFSSSSDMPEKLLSRPVLIDVSLGVASVQHNRSDGEYAGVPD